MVTLYCVDSFDSIGRVKRSFYKLLDNAKRTVKETIDEVPKNQRDFVTIRREVGPTEEAIRQGRYTTSTPIWSYGFFELDALENLEE